MLSKRYSVLARLFSVATASRSKSKHRVRDLCRVVEPPYVRSLTFSLQQSICLGMELPLPFHVGQVLGSGGFASVHICRDLENPKDIYAVKFISKKQIVETGKQVCIVPGT